MYSENYFDKNLEIFIFLFAGERNVLSERNITFLLYKTNYFDF